MPGGRGGGGKWKPGWPGWSRIGRAIKRGIGTGPSEPEKYFGWGYFDISIITCEYICIANHEY